MPYLPRAGISESLVSRCGHWRRYHLTHLGPPPHLNTPKRDVQGDDQAKLSWHNRAGTQQFSGFLLLALLLPQPTQTHRRAQLQRFRLLVDAIFPRLEQQERRHAPRRAARWGKALGKAS